MSVQHGSDYSVPNHAYAVYVSAFIATGYEAQRSDSWSTAVDPVAVRSSIEELEPALLYEGHNWHGYDVVFTAGDALVALQLSDGSIICRVAAESLPAADLLFQRFAELIPRAASEDGTIPITFWSLSPQGPQSRFRAIDVRPWEGIAANYCERTRELLEPLALEFKPARGGQLLLWHGEPGTGKTHAIRSLGWEWRDWCDVHYITDPEQFFGESAAYMLEVLLAEPADGRWKLLLLEDSGELLAADAKLQTGQGLSRLLNVVDGMIGQGLRVLVLITTNDELRKLHPAVSRPGRCASIIEFAPFTSREALRWLEAQCGPATRAATGDMTLAELYAQAEGWELRAESERAVGFGVSR